MVYGVVSEGHNIAWKLQKTFPLLLYCRYKFFIVYLLFWYSLGLLETKVIVTSFGFLFSMILGLFFYTLQGLLKSYKR